MEKILALAYKILFILLVSFEVFAQSTPSGYTTYYHLRKWALHANPGADSLNQNTIEIDYWLRQLAVADTGKITSTGLDYLYGRYLFSNYSVLQLPLYEQAMIYPRSLRGDDKFVYYERNGSDQPDDVDSLMTFRHSRELGFVDTTGILKKYIPDTVATLKQMRTADTASIKTTGIDTVYGRLHFNRTAILQLPRFYGAEAYERSLRGDSLFVYYEKQGSDEQTDIDTLMTFKYARENYAPLTNYWNDLLGPLVTAKQGANSKPDFDYTRLAYKFPTEDTTHQLYMVMQIPHDYKEGDTIVPHLHWEQSASTKPTWKLAYKWVNIGDAVPTSWTILSSNTGAITYSSGTIHQLSSFGAIAGTGKKISSLFICILYRNDADPKSDCYALSFDIHYKIDYPGSRSETTK